MKNILFARPDLETAKGEDTHNVSITIDPKKYPKAQGLLEAIDLKKVETYKNGGKIKMTLVHEKDEVAFNSTFNAMKSKDLRAMAKRGMIIDAQREIREEWEKLCGIEDPKKATAREKRVEENIAKLTAKFPDKSKEEIKEIAVLIS